MATLDDTLAAASAQGQETTGKPITVTPEDVAGTGTGGFAPATTGGTTAPYVPPTGSAPDVTALASETPPALAPPPDPKAAVPRSQDGAKPPLVSQTNAEPDPDTVAMEHEAQRRLGLKFTPDFRVPGMQDAVQTALTNLQKTGGDDQSPGANIQRPVMTQGQPMIAGTIGTALTGNVTFKPTGQAAVDTALQEKQRDADTLDKLSTVYGNNIMFDPSRTMPPDIATQVGHQLGLGNPIDANTIFKRYYPQGDLAMIDWGPNDLRGVYYRENPSQAFKPVDNLPANIGAMSNFQNAANVVTTAMGLPGVMKGAAPAATIIGRTAQFLKEPALQLGTNVGGNILDWAANKAQGLSTGSQEVYQNALNDALARNRDAADYNRIVNDPTKQRTPYTMDQMQEAATNAMTNADISPEDEAVRAFDSAKLAGLASLGLKSGVWVGSKVVPLAYRTVAGGVKMLRGKSTIPSQTQAGQNAIKFLQGGLDPQDVNLSNWAQGEGLKPLTIGQAHKWEPVRLVARQASAQTGQMQQTSLEQMQSAKLRAEKEVAQNKNSVTDPKLVKQMIQAERDALVAQLPVNKIGFSDVGREVQSQLTSWQNNSRVQIRDLGQRMIDTAGDKWIGIPMKAVHNVADTMEEGTWAPGRERLDEDGNVTDEIPEHVQVSRPTEEIRPVLRRIHEVGDYLRTIEKVMPRGNTRIYNAAEQWQALERDLYHLQTSSSNGLTRQQAFDLRNAFMQALKDGQSEISTAKKAGIATQEFQDNYNRFTDAYGQFKDDERMFHSIINARDPGQMADAIVRPGKAATIARIKVALTGPDSTPEMQRAWGAIQDGLRSKLEEDPTKIVDILDKFRTRDQAALDLVLPRAEQDNWRTLGANIEELNRSFLAQEGSRPGRTPLANATAMAQRMPYDEIATRVAQTGGKTGPFATSVRAGFWNDVMSQAMEADEHGVMGLNPHKFVNAINKYTTNSERAAALEQVFTKADWDFVSNMRRYAIKSGADVSSVGGGIQAGSIASHFTNPESYAEPSRIVMAMSKMLGAKVFSQVVATPVGQQLVQQAFKMSNTAMAVRFLARATSAYVQEATRPDRQPTKVQTYEIPAGEPNYGTQHTTY